MTMTELHRTQSCGYANGAHYWRCACGWIDERPVDPGAPAEQHLHALDEQWTVWCTHSGQTEEA